MLFLIENMEHFAFYLHALPAPEIRRLVKFPLPFKSGKWDLYVKFIYAKYPDTFFVNVTGCCFCHGNERYICKMCEQKMMLARDNAIKALTIDKMVDACIMLRRMGLIDDIIHYIMIDMHQKKVRY